jgi:hypothetical protein
MSNIIIYSSISCDYVARAHVIYDKLSVDQTKASLPLSRPYSKKSTTTTTGSGSSARQRRVPVTIFFSHIKKRKDESAMDSLRRSRRRQGDTSTSGAAGCRDRRNVAGRIKNLRRTGGGIRCPAGGARARRQPST